MIFFIIFIIIIIGIGILANRELSRDRERTQNLMRQYYKFRSFSDEDLKKIHPEEENKDKEK